MPRVGSLVGLILLLGCRATVVMPSAARGRARTVDAASHPRAAFLVQTDRETWIVPLDGGRSASALPGIWSARPGTAHGRIEIEMDLAATDSVATDGIALPICSDAAVDAPCTAGGDGSLSVVVHAVIAGTGPPTWTVADGDGRTCTCLAMPGVSSDDSSGALDPEIIAEAAASGIDPEEYARECLGEAPAHWSSVAVQGGALFRGALTHEGACNGMSIYSGDGDVIPIGPPPPSSALAIPKPTGCVDSFQGLDLDGALAGEPECILGQPDCGCDDIQEIEAYVVRRGRLVHAVANIDPVGGGCTCAASIAVDPEHCPSAVDPCGDPRAFGDLEDLEDFWIATDGSAALVVERERMRVVRPRVAAPVRDDPWPNAVLGVEFHRDTRLVDPPRLPSRFRPALPRLAASDRSFSGSATAWGDRCVVHLREGRLDEAEAACFAGLRQGGKPKTRGALAFNLGRIAESRGDPATALSWYRRSDRLRPGNAAVSARISALLPAR